MLRQKEFASVDSTQTTCTVKIVSVFSDIWYDKRVGLFSSSSPNKCIITKDHLLHIKFVICNITASCISFDDGVRGIAVGL